MRDYSTPDPDYKVCYYKFHILLSSNFFFFTEIATFPAKPACELIVFREKKNRRKKKTRKGTMMYQKSS